MSTKASKFVGRMMTCFYDSENDERKDSFGMEYYNSLKSYLLDSN